MLAGFGALSALPAHADDLFVPPPGCALTMTVQLRECQVANHFQCASDPGGERWISYADGQGEYFLSRIDHQTRWVESISLETGEIDYLDVQASADHASFDTLLDAGRDDYDFVTLNNFGETRRYVGHDQLTGQTVTIDGVPLERSEFSVKTLDGAGNFISSRSGLQFISRKMRVFFGDSEDYKNAFGDEASSASPPASFAFPGDAGFGASTPVFDCDMMMTQLDMGQTRWKAEQ
ncbi:hypothetical protein BFP70_14935 [Thioclava sp. SK-1]|nr:hypothetical protein BFP70_14935 [Thioclava sp. SK-1]